MRLGCSGCLTLLVALACLAGAGWIVAGVFQEPGQALPRATGADGVRAQQKIYEIVRGGTRARGGGDGTVALSEPEVNAFLSRHLAEVADVPLPTFGIRLREEGLVEVTGGLPLQHVVGELRLGRFAALLPRSWRERPVWFHLRARVAVEPASVGTHRRFLRLDVERFELGRRRLPALLLRLLLNPSTLRLLRWQLPGQIEDLTVEAGRVVIRTAGPR